MTEGEKDKPAETGDTAKTVDESPSAQRLMLFGTDLTKIPCLRKSLLNGFIAAAVGGIGGFFYTSKLRVGCHSAFASYWIVACGTWFTCRYKLYVENKFWEHTKQNVNEMKVKTDEYNLPKGVQKLNEKPGQSGDKPVEKS